MTVFASQWAIASVTRCWSGIARVDVVGNDAARPPELAAGQDHASLGRTPRIAELLCSTSSTLPRSMSPSKIARPSTTEYWTALAPKVRPEMIAVPTSGDPWASGLSWESAVFFDRAALLLVLFLVVLRFGVSAMMAPLESAEVAKLSRSLHVHLVDETLPGPPVFRG